MNARLVLFTISTAILSACSLLLDRRADQCSTDGDCAKFAGTRCDQKLRLCLVIADGPDTGSPPANDAGGKEEDSGSQGSPDAGSEVAVDAGADVAVDGCVGANGCYACAPANDFQFVNGCTDAACKPFDNRTRLKNRLLDGGLTPLPAREGGS
jgi:hypothetical protein